MGWGAGAPAAPANRGRALQLQLRRRVALPRQTRAELSCPLPPAQHVTFFWNGNRSGFFDSSLETYVEIPSDNVPFNELPAMKAREICEAGKEALRSGKFDLVRINFEKCV